MSHRLTAVIGSPEVIERVVTAACGVAPTELGFGLVIAPLGDDAIDRLTNLQPGEYMPGFTYLSQALEVALMAAAGSGTIGYIVTSYFGGTGSQAAAVYRDGQATFRAASAVGPRPSGPDMPINAALRALGVPALRGRDEFDTVGLGRFRSPEDLGLLDAEDD